MLLPRGSETITVAGLPVLGWYNPAEHVVYFRPPRLDIQPGGVLVVRGSARTIDDVEQWNTAGTVAKLVKREAGFTAITIRRDTTTGVQDPLGAGYDTPTDIPNEWTTVATDVPATITPASGATIRPGDTEEINYKLDADPCDLRHTDQVIDQADGTVYAVEWAHTSSGSRGRTTAGLRTFAGAVTTEDIEDQT